MSNRRPISYVWLAAFALLCGTPLLAQRSGQVMNLNTHEGKYSTGGFGAGFLFGTMMAGSLHHGELGTAESGIQYGKSKEIDRTESVTGLCMDFQFGSNNDTVGTDVGLDFTSHNVETTTTVGGTPTLINKSVTVMYLGFDFTINLMKSEFIEKDGRRTRDDTNVSLIVGPKLGMMFGDLADINGPASLGLDFGIAFDFPLSDSFQIAPAMWFETNMHLSADPDLATFRQTDTGFSGGGEPTFDGVILRQHNFIPSFAVNLGSDFILTPLFVGKRGNLINNWRFSAGLYLTVPITFNAFMAEVPGDPLYDDSDAASYVAFSLQAAYFW